MYSVNKKKVVKKKWKFKDFSDIENISGFLMPSRKAFIIGDDKISNVVVVSKKLAQPIVSTVVSKKYKKLINELTDLLLTDDTDDGDCYREALNQIERFRMIVKNKYRDFLLDEELKIMAKQLKLLQKEAKLQFAEIQNSMIMYNENYRSR